MSLHPFHVLYSKHPFLSLPANNHKDHNSSFLSLPDTETVRCSQLGDLVSPKKSWWVECKHQFFVVLVLFPESLHRTYLLNATLKHWQLKVATCNLTTWEMLHIHVVLLLEHGLFNAELVCASSVVSDRTCICTISAKTFFFAKQIAVLQICPHTQYKLQKKLGLPIKIYTPLN